MLSLKSISVIAVFVEPILWTATTDVLIREVIFHWCKQMIAKSRPQTQDGTCGHRRRRGGGLIIYLLNLNYLHAVMMKNY